MIPTRNPGDHLQEALESVLAQDPGPEQLQLCVLDDASDGDTVERTVDRCGADRVALCRHAHPLGIAGNWNACIEHSRGIWVHILHQDDRVLPGFYERLGRANEVTPRVGAAFSRNVLIDDAGAQFGVSPLHRETAGIHEGWLTRIAVSNEAQCAATVVRRSTYEAIGGFRSDLPFALDWEMWVRIAAHFQVYYEPRPLAAFRVHDANETARLCERAENVADLLRAIDVIARHLPPGQRDGLVAKARGACVDHALGTAWRLLDSGHRAAARAQLDAVLALSPALRFQPRVLRLYRHAFVRWLRNRVAA